MPITGTLDDRGATVPSVDYDHPGVASHTDPLHPLREHAQFRLRGRPLPRCAATRTRPGRTAPRSYRKSKSSITGRGLTSMASYVAWLIVFMTHILSPFQPHADAW